MARKIKFEGKVYSFPDDATDEEVQAALHQATFNPGEFHPTKHLDSLKGTSNPAEGEVAFPGLARAGEHPGEFDPAMSGFGDVIKHVGMGASPAMLPAIVAHPIPALAGLAAAVPTQQLLQRSGEAIGLPGTGEVAGDIAGGLMAHGVGTALSRVPIPDINIPFMPRAGKMAQAGFNWLKGEPISAASPRFGTGDPLGMPLGVSTMELPRRPDAGWMQQGVTIPERNDYTPINPIVPAGGLPSGRQVGPIPMAEPQATPPARTPLWRGIQITPRNTYEPIEPIQGPFPSGRVPGTGSAAQPATSPIAGVSGPRPQIPSVQVPEGAAPTMSPEELMKLETAEKTRLSRALHARAQEMELPNSPAGSKSSPGFLSGLAKQLYGKDYARLTVDELNDFIENKLPTFEVKK